MTAADEEPTQTAAPPASVPTPATAVVWGSLAMILSVLGFTLLDATNKILVETHSPFFLSWARCVAQVVILTVLMPVIGAGRMLSTQRPLLHLARGLAVAAVSVCVTLSVRHLPLTETYVVGFLAPFLATLLAVIWLAERPTVLQWVLITGGFAGVLVALQPTAPEADWRLAYPLGFAIANAIYFVLTRIAGRTEGRFAQLYYVGVFASLALTVVLPWHWETPTFNEWGLIASVGLYGTLAHLLLIQAFTRAPTAVVAPMVYFQIVWASLVGYLWFGDVPAETTLLGAAIIVVAGAALMRTQAR